MIKIAIVLFTFMTAIDITVLATIMPHIIASLGDMQLYPLMSSAYLVSFFLITPIFGKVADHFGCKKAAFIAMGLFLVGSLFCGLSHSMRELIASRLLQGMGAAGLTNISFITIGKLYKEDSKRSLMQAALSTVWATASIVGPLFGAYLTLLYSWRFVFLINLPIGLLALFFLSSFKEVHVKLEEKFDKKSIGLFMGGTLLLFLTTGRIAASGIGGYLGVYKILLLIISFGLLALFVKRSLRIASPLIPFHLLKTPLIATCIAFGIISGACLTISNTLISLYIQGALRESLAKAGYVISATSIGWAIGSFFCGLLLHRIGLRAICFIATGTLITGFSLLSRATTSDTISYLIVSNAVLGFGLGSIVNMTITGVQKAAISKLMGRATSFLSLVRSGGASLGAAAAGFLQLYYFKSALITANESLVSPHISALLTAHPEKFLDKNFCSTIPLEQFHMLCNFFALSIEKVFILPIILLVITLPLAFFLPKK
ncbi:MAG: drug resistance transporter, drug:H+ antiporter-2 family protein [Chlamydiia bacterium]|nr:drug resistance transporter, drug:H+ antiporter-2 family protein [Chlamydiia bacterium]